MINIQMSSTRLKYLQKRVNSTHNETGTSYPSVTKTFIVTKKKVNTQQPSALIISRTMKRNTRKKRRGELSGSRVSHLRVSKTNR